MSTVGVSAAVSAVVTVIVGLFVNWGQRTGSWLYRQATPDHLPITPAAGWSNRAASATNQVRVLVRCAPNRSLWRRKLWRREFNPDAAVSLIREHFTDLFPPEPAFSMLEYGVRFESAAGVDDAYAWVHANGAVELCMSIPTAAADPGPIAISVLDIANVVMRVRQATYTRHYDKVFGARLPGLPRKFDWMIAVSETITVPDRGNRSWEQLNFPEGPPPRAGTQQQPSCPPEGYAATALRNRKRRQPPRDLVRIFLRDFLYQNGYHSIDAAVADTLHALDNNKHARPSMTVPAPKLSSHRGTVESQPPGRLSLRANKDAERDNSDGRSASQG